MCSALIVMSEPQTFNIRNKKKILCYLHMDWILVLQHLRDSVVNSQQVMEYLQLETGDSNTSKKIKHINGTSKSRSTIFTVIDTHPYLKGKGIPPERRPCPSARMFFAALTSRSCFDPQPPHVHSLTFNPLRPFGLPWREPQAEHVWDV